MRAPGNGLRLRLIFWPRGAVSLFCFAPDERFHPVAEIETRQDEMGLVKTHGGCGFKKGDPVRIIDGPLNDLEGLFDCPTDEERVTILLQLMGREVKVCVPLETVYACA